MDLRSFLKRWWGIGFLVGLTFIPAIILSGCIAGVGTSSATNSQPPKPALGNAATGIISGKITNSINAAPVAKAKLATDPVIPDLSVVTDSSGAFSATLPVGTYKLNITRDGYTAASDNVVLVAGQTVIKNIVLKPLKPVAINAGLAQEAAPGSSVTLKAGAEPLDGSTIKSYEWSQASGVPASLGDTKSDTLIVTLNKAPAYKAQLVKNLESLDRINVMGINPESLISAQTTTFKIIVTTSSGTYSNTVAVTAKLPYDFTTGIANVPQGIPVLLNGKKQNSYSWSISGPAGSKSDLDDSTSRNPAFTPDIVGKYTLTEKVSGATLTVYAGTWMGMITGQDAKGLPVAAGCVTCHNGTIAVDQFTPWSKSGHAVILTKNINDPAGHWSLACVGCHSVGYNPTVNNGGFDEAAAAENWKAPAHGDPSNWANMLSQDPKTAKLANIQCENCHGPNNGSGLHANGVVDAERLSISSDVCGSCHGEPPRHGLFQQWEMSGHSNFEVAIDEASVDTRGAMANQCGRCHIGQGFLSWTKQKDMTQLIQGKNGNATVDELKAMGLTKDAAQPQTCTVCHDPHDQGNGTVNATVRITGNTSMLPSGYKAVDVGKGALCITCHNTRNGSHNDSAPPTNFTAPHVAAQGDVLMGQNAYFVNTERSPHSMVQDTCVTCHMEDSPQPAEFMASANHSFKADINMCGKCHSDKLNGKALQSGFKDKLQVLANSLSKNLLNKLPASITIMDYTPHSSGGKSYDLKSSTLTIAKDNIASVGPVEIHGQQSFIIKLKNSLTVTYNPDKEQPHSVSVNQVQVQLGDITSDGKTTVVLPTDNLVKAGWNYLLLHGDSSEGIHNPSWINQVLDASTNALK